MKRFRIVWRPLIGRSTGTVLCNTYGRPIEVNEMVADAMVERLNIDAGGWRLYLKREVRREPRRARLLLGK